jgi:hypothetical protein
MIQADGLMMQPLGWSSCTVCRYDQLHGTAGSLATSRQWSQGQSPVVARGRFTRAFLAFLGKRVSPSVSCSLRITDVASEFVTAFWWILCVSRIGQ